jgi:hypothetical protein
MMEQIIKPVLLMRSNESVPSRAILSTAFLGIAYLVIFILLGWIGYVEPIAPFTATPWNPRAGLSIALILMFGADGPFCSSRRSPTCNPAAAAATDHRALDGGPDRRVYAAAGLSCCTRNCASIGRCDRCATSLLAIERPRAPPCGCGYVGSIVAGV